MFMYEAMEIAILLQTYLLVLVAPQLERNVLNILNQISQ
jgi:hypothetical protein